MRDTDIVFKTLTGDTEAADRLMGIARTHIGILKQQMALGGLKVGSRTVPFPDGSSLRIVVAGGQTRVMLDAPQGVGGRPISIPLQTTHVPPVEVPTSEHYGIYAVLGDTHVINDPSHPLIAIAAYPFIVNGRQYDAPHGGAPVATGHFSYDYPQMDVSSVGDQLVAQPIGIPMAVLSSKTLQGDAAGRITKIQILRNGQVYSEFSAADTPRAGPSVTPISGVFDPSVVSTTPINLVQFTMLSPVWDQGVQARLMGEHGGAAVAPVTVDMPTGVSAMTVLASNSAIPPTVNGIPTRHFPNAPTFNWLNIVELENNSVINVEATASGDESAASIIGVITPGRPKWAYPDPNASVIQYPTMYITNASLRTDYPDSFSLLNPAITQVYLIITQYANKGETKFASAVLTLPDGWGGSRDITINLTCRA